MPYYEVIYETGAHSVAFYEDDEEAVNALDAHNQRAVEGSLGGPTGHAAERIKQVLTYSSHPAEHVLTNGETTSPVHNDPGPHESKYVLDNVGVLEGSWS